jgi:hypothetical protein
VAPVGMLFLGHLSYKKKSEKKNQKFVNYSKCEISEFKTENVQEVKMIKSAIFVPQSGGATEQWLRPQIHPHHIKGGGWRHIEANDFIMPDSTPPPTFPHPIRGARDMI